MEGEPSFQLEMRALKDTGDRRCQTTLLPPDSPIFKSIQNALVVSIIKNGCRIPVQQKRIKELSKGAVSPWKGRPFKFFGADRGQHLIPSTMLNTMLTDALVTPTTVWVSNVATAAEFAHPFQPDLVAEGQSGPSAKPNTTTTVTYQEPLEPMPIQKPNTKRVRVVKGRGKAALAKAETFAENVVDPIHATVPKSPASTRSPREGKDVSNQPLDQPLQRTPLAREDQAISVQDLSEFAVSRIALPNVDSPPTPPANLAAINSPYHTASGDAWATVVFAEQPTKAHSPQVALDREGQSQAVHGLFELVPTQTALLETMPLEKPLEKCGYGEPSLQTVAGIARQPMAASKLFLQRASGKEDQSTLVRDRPELQLQAALPEIALPEITPPYMPPSPPPAPKPTEFGWEGRPVVRGRAGALVDTTMPQEHQNSGKPKPQSLKRTMGQKAPSRGLVGGNAARSQKFEEVSRQLLALALPRRGPITFEMGIGRLLINHETGSKEFKAKPFSLPEWSSAFPEKTDTNTNKLETIFTPRLTTSLVDVESILEIHLSQGRRIFDPELILRNVTYVYKCTTKHGDQVTINLDEDGTFKILGPEVLIGSLDFHFPKRVWDASLRLTTSGLYSNRFQKQVDAIISNLKIFVSQGGTSLDLSTQTSDQELVITSITLRRKTLYSSKVYADLLLQLCEVQDLHVSRNENEYQGTIKESKEMIDTGRLWWEASIASVSAGEILGVNDTLELGEVAKWSPHTIINRGVVRDLYSLAHEIVTNIDNVGFLNKGVKGSSGSKGQATSYQTSHQTSSKPTEGGPYW